VVIIVVITVWMIVPAGVVAGAVLSRPLLTLGVQGAIAPLELTTWFPVGGDVASMPEDEVFNDVQVDLELVVERALVVSGWVVDILELIAALPVRISDGQENSLWYLGGVQAPCPEVVGPRAVTTT
jgi:hypothetical protein